MARSLKVAKKFIEKVKQAVQRNGFARQQDLAESLNLASSTIWNFLNGRPVSILNFYEICHKLDLDYREIADFGVEDQIEEDLTLELSSQEVRDQDFEQEPIEEKFSNYVERPPIESLCYQTIEQPGSLLRIRAPKHMGKSLLLDRIIHNAKEKKYRIVRLNLLLADQAVLENLDNFLRWFCAVVSQQLRLPNQLNDYWEEDLSSSYSCTTYIEEHFLGQLDSPLVFALDDVDYIFTYLHIAEDFFRMLRTWFEKARSRQVWKKLRLVLAYSTEELVSMDINHSPFNVGIPIELPDFTSAQIEQLAKKQGLDFDTLQVEQLMKMVGGHPYLIQRAISCLTRKEATFSQLVETLPNKSSIYSSYLRAHWSNLQQYPELADAMKQIITKNKLTR
ncbi:MAG: AAA-like domain-containing protein, partial [Cyanobacteria bacterium P01_F01_bin.143]